MGELLSNPSSTSIKKGVGRKYAKTGEMITISDLRGREGEGEGIKSKSALQESPVTLGGLQRRKGKRNSETHQRYRLTAQ